MDKLFKLTFPGGMNNLTQEGSLPLTGRDSAGQARRIMNMDVLDDGTLKKRDGLELTIAVPGGAHSLWTCSIGTYYAASDGIYRMNPGGGSAVLVCDGAPSARVSYCEVNSDIYWSSESSQGKLIDGVTAAPWMPGRLGSIVRYYNGRIYLVQGNMVFPTDAHHFDRIDPFRNFIGMPANIVMFEPVSGGIYVGCDGGGTYFLGGGDYREFSMAQVDDFYPVPGTGLSIPGETYGVEGDAAAWLTRRGWVIGLPGGSINRLNDKSIALPKYPSGASLLREKDGIRQLLCMAAGGGNGSSAKAVDTVTTEVIRAGRQVPGI